MLAPTSNGPCRKHGGGEGAESERIDEEDQRCPVATPVWDGLFWTKRQQSGLLFLPSLSGCQLDAGDVLSKSLRSHTLIVARRYANLVRNEAQTLGLDQCFDKTCMKDKANIALVCSFVQIINRDEPQTG